MSRSQFLFDANLPPRLAKALRLLDKGVVHVGDIEELGRSAPDDLILDFAADRGYRLMTVDRAMKRSPHFQALIADRQLGVYFVRTGKAKQLSSWEISKLLVRAWDDIERFAEAHPLPFSATISRQGRVTSNRQSR